MIVEVEFLRRMTYNIREYLKAIDKKGTTYFYAFILLGAEPDGKTYVWDEKSHIRILLVCNRWGWVEKIRMFGIPFEICSTDLTNVKELLSGVEMTFELEESTAKSYPLGH